MPTNSQLVPRTERTRPTRNILGNIEFGCVIMGLSGLVILFGCMFLFYLGLHWLDLF